MIDPSWREHAVTRGWARLGSVYGVLVALLLIFRERFDWERELIEIPALPLAAGLVIAGVAFLATPRLIGDSLALGEADRSHTLVLVIAIGLVLRVVLIWSTPALEDDFYRYLWDGGVTANGINPYRIAPASAAANEAPEVVRALAAHAGYVFDRINHAKLRTIYPAVAQALFAVAYLAEPWSLLAWRLVCLAGEGVTLGLLLLILREVGRPALWVSLYWLNPLVIKELVNSAHMEAIVVPFVLAAVLLAMRRRLLSATAILVLAGATKVWPLLLAPLILRPLVAAPRRLATALSILLVGSVVLALPIVLAGLDRSAGVVAYASAWQRNGALVPGLSWLLAALGLSEPIAGGATRVAVTIAIGLISVALALRPLSGAPDLAQRSALLVTATLLLSPAQYPWYLAWVMPFMTLLPIRAMLAATALMPIYYVSFYFRATEMESVFNSYVVWAIWIPIWVLLWQQWQDRRARVPATQ